MITGLLLWIINILILLVCAILPAWSLPTWLLEMFTEIGSAINLFNDYLPLVAALQVFLLILAFEIAIMTFRLGMGLISIFRGGGKVDI